MKRRYILYRQARRGAALILTMVFMTVMTIGASAYLSMVTSETRMTKIACDAKRAFYLAESGIERAKLEIKNGTRSLNANYRLSGNASDINIQIRPLSDVLFSVTTTSNVDGVNRTVRTIIQRNLQSEVFDHAYFINNWGWFYGSGITNNGDVRSNGRFDFRQRPRVEGEVFAQGAINDGGQGIRGKAGTTERDGSKPYQHPYYSKINMPNLTDLSYYQTLAQVENSSIIMGSRVIVDKTFNGNIVLIGTPSEPVEINGPVVVSGDVIIKGSIKGQGTIYAGRNIYVAGDIQYKNTPSSPRPASDDPNVTDGWVRANKDKDLVGFAARESIIMGDYTSRTGGAWYSNYWLFSMGSEDVGRDGIPDTGDRGEGDGRFEAQYEDLDGDGVMDGNYTWSNVTTQVPISAFSNVPRGTREFGNIATNLISRVDGVFYTNHAFAGRTGYGVHFNGALISRDEAIVYRNTLTFNYDERIDSRYSSGTNRLIDLNLPVARKVEVTDWWE